jgi:molecular chaperone DnaK
MSNRTINFGIDLGTTNSAIAKFDQGQVEIFKNPAGHKETLPSVVGYRKERILVGDKAREFLLVDPKNVVATFKRKMGTSESYAIESLGQSKTPVELSALVLKQLKGFIHTGEQLDAAVITIPASFDTVQSNATKQAGQQAGIRQVVLLQEPIAASLAYANKKGKSLQAGSWLVYDLGGGTFDVALVRIAADGELKVVDHEGDNYLGGADFDQLLAEKVLVPRLNAEGHFDNLLAELKSRTGRWNALWERLLFFAEKAKVELSHATSSEVEFTTEDDNGESMDISVEITRTEYEALVQPLVDKTVEMVRKILTRNSLQPTDLQFILMVGGSTLIPCVRKRVEDCVGVTVACDIDPTTAIAIGAAYFAAGKPFEVIAIAGKAPSAAKLQVKAVYPKATRETEEMFAAKVSGEWQGCYYRIRRQDGGFDSGIKEMRERISEDLPLVADSYNIFSFEVLGGNHERVMCEFESIQIAHGKFSVAGQLLPEDICLQIDDNDTGEARLDLLAQRNTLLPGRSKKTYTVNRTVLKGAAEDVIHLIVKEGSVEDSPESAKTVGYLKVTGQQLIRDLPKGTDIDVKLEISESRDLVFTVYVEACDQEFREVFAPTFREVPTQTLAYESRCLLEKIEGEIETVVDLGNVEAAKDLKLMLKRVVELEKEASKLTADDSTDDRYKLEDEKRRCAAEVGRLTKGKRFDTEKREYEGIRDRCEMLVLEHGNDRERKHYDDLLKREEYVLVSGNARRLEELTEQLQILSYTILRRVPDFLQRRFEYLISMQTKMNDQTQARSLVDSGRLAIERGQWERLDETNIALQNLLPSRDQEELVNQGFTGIGR